MVYLMNKEFLAVGIGCLVTLVTQLIVVIWWAATLSVSVANLAAKIGDDEKAVLILSSSAASNATAIASLEAQLTAQTEAIRKIDQHLTVIETYLYDSKKGPR
jgi:hypothetical protein